jgi:hypothetical protein
MRVGHFSVDIATKWSKVDRGDGITLLLSRKETE